MMMINDDDDDDDDSSLKFCKKFRSLLNVDSWLHWFIFKQLS